MRRCGPRGTGKTMAAKATISPSCSGHNLSEKLPRAELLIPASPLAYPRAALERLPPCHVKCLFGVAFLPTGYQTYLRIGSQTGESMAAAITQSQRPILLPTLDMPAFVADCIRNCVNK